MSKLCQINASAGSGKTYDLTRRFLQCLAECDVSHSASVFAACAAASGNNTFGLSDILAITFTNAAADEMRSRIIRELKIAVLGNAPQESPVQSREARTQLTHIMRDFSALNIRTIDSLLHLIVRAAALDLKLHPDFQPVFSSEEVLLPYLDLLLERAGQGNTAMRERLRRACRELIVHGNHKGFLSGEGLLRKLRKLLDDVLRGVFVNLTPENVLRNKLSAIEVEARQAAQDFLDEAQNLQWDKRAFNSVQQQAEGNMDKCSSAYANKAYAEELFRKGTFVPDSVAQAYARYAACSCRYVNEGALLAEALHHVPFVELADILAEAFLLNQEQEGTLPSVLVPINACTALQSEYGVSDMLCRIGSRFRHFLLDEFQDTNLEQWNALYPLIEDALARGGSLTWVGDVKQSIYGWRGAKPELFDSILTDKKLADIAPNPECSTLPCNWRSRREIIDYNNRFFGPLAELSVAAEIMQDMLPSDAPQQVIAASADLVARAFANTVQQYAPTTPDSGLVQIISLEPASSEALREAALDGLCDLLNNNIAKRRSWSDVLVLVRGNAVASRISERLVQEGIPVITENSLLLAKHPLIVQTIAFLQFIESPIDDVAFWTMLTGSIFLEHQESLELSWDILHDWCSARQKGPLYLQFRNRWPDIWRRLLMPFYNQAGLMTQYDMVQEWFLRLAVEERFPYARIFLRRFMEVIQNAETKNLALSTDFLQHWHDHSAEEKVPMPDNMDAVRVMTIHKSKGLEAPIVIIPLTNFTARIDAKPCLVEQGNLRMAVPNIKAFGENYYAELAQKCRENLNLLYVASTRAKDELYIFHANTASSRVKSLSSAMNILWRHAGLTVPCVMGQMPEPETPKKSVASASRDSPPENIPEYASCWRPMEWLPRLKIFRNSLPVDSNHNGKVQT